MAVLSALLGIATSIVGLITAVVKLRKEFQDRHATEERILHDPDKPRPPWSPGQTVLASTLFGFGGGAFFGSLCFLVDPDNFEGGIGMFMILSIAGILIGLKVGFKLAESYKASQAEWFAQLANRGDRTRPPRDEYDDEAPRRRR